MKKENTGEMVSRIAKSGFITEKIEKLVFEPVRESVSFGELTQISKIKYLGVNIYETVFYPWNIFKDPVYTYSVDRIVPTSVKIPGARININMYTEDGYGIPEFRNIENAISYINTIKQ